MGRRNERGERLIQFCQENKLIIANTWFQQPVRKLYTWKSPGDISRNQIDYIMLNERFRNCIKQAKTYPGADMNSDHNPVVVKINMKLKRTNATKRSEQLELNLPSIDHQTDNFTGQSRETHAVYMVNHRSDATDGNSFLAEGRQHHANARQNQHFVQVGDSSKLLSIHSRTLIPPNQLICWLYSDCRWNHRFLRKSWGVRYENVKLERA